MDPDLEIEMTTDPPIACTLTAAEMPARLAEIRAVGDAALRSAEAGGSGAVLRFGPDPDIRTRLAAIVAAESVCCAFLEFDLDDSATETVLTIEAPEGGEQAMHQLVGAFRGPSMPA